MLIPPDANVILYSVLGITSIGLWKGKKMIIKIRAIKKNKRKKDSCKIFKDYYFKQLNAIEYHFIMFTCHFIGILNINKVTIMSHIYAYQKSYFRFAFFSESICFVLWACKFVWEDDVFLFLFPNNQLMLLS